MTKEALQNEYGSENVFDNQFELGKAIQEYGLRNRLKNILSRFPIETTHKDPEVFYDIAERALVKNVAFFNDGYYIIESFEDIEIM